MVKRRFIAIIFIFTAIFTAAQNQPRTAVVPFNAVGVSDNEALVITGLFETALVQTESFNVIEQNQMNEIMEAQAYSIGGCTDESCAIEVGKLLSAEQIILGDLSSIGGKIILNAKIIDVESGRNIKADKVDAAGMGAMTDAVELLAFKLAGLTYATGGDVKVATTFGELLIETNPLGADIFINGVKKGVSPDLFNRIPLGRITVEARKGNLYGTRSINVTADTARLSITLEEQFGKLFVKSSEPDVEVYLDGRKLGPLGSGFFDNLAVGGHLLELKGNSTYWKDDIEVEAGKSTRVEAYPRGFGYVDYRLPESASAYVKGPDFSRTVTGSGILKLDEGIYRVSVTGDIYKSFEKKISVTTGDRFDFKPQLELTQAHIKELADNRKETEYEKFNSRLSEIKRRFTDDYRYTDKDLSELEMLGTEISTAEFSFEDIKKQFEQLNSRAVETKSKQDELDELNRRKVELEMQLSLLEQSQKSHQVGGWTSLGIGAASGLFSGTSFILSWVKYQDYLEAGEDEWEDLKSQYEMWDIIGWVAGGVAVAGAAVGPVLWLTSPDDNEKAGVAANLAVVNSNISSLTTELQ